MPEQGYEVSPTDGGVLASAGFAAAGVAAGIKRRPGAVDVCIIDAGRPAPAAAVFTLNTMAAPPVEVSREAVADGMLRAWVVNAGNANACTGEVGLADAGTMVETAASALGCEPSEIGVASTGVIGVPLPIDRVCSGVRAAAGALGSSAEHGEAAARAIMTTDTFVKQASFSVRVDGAVYTVGGMAKGSGMIEPNMATMLAFLTTDAPLTTEACRMLLATVADRTFNRITVDGDSSTNDTCALMASGAAGGGPIGPDHPHLPAIEAVLMRTCDALARMIVRDGEGATKLVEVTVRGARSEGDAVAAAREIANSPLFKTALFGRDANWGRVAMALGNSGAAIDPAKVEIVFAGITTCKDGTAVEFSEEEAAEALAADEVGVTVDLHLGTAQATVLTCDLTYEYVRINGEYRT
ncbi:MAG: bifunctional glutamate N-acetyltransferase/amino-acid acetyltransferase ArgJ [Anaerosomatales bacterium]|nr:bifunctional glutamate N-acetyltransferase/amino-acid acetyltransferase ArgJ [Anaerosomatales bacterium]MDT8434857.1 bifunctional glutamate N-acetyltransferase/amino-acid acetyltransferase ArgJ [Anaerosomatales bacterium]